MAKGIRELKGRIRGVRNIAKITRAMEMVATTKLKRLQVRAEGSRPYGDALRVLVGRLAARVADVETSLLRPREEGRIGLFAITADKGLCGAYNANMFRTIQGFAAEHGEGDVALYLLGDRGKKFFRKRPPGVAHGYEDVVEKLTHGRVREIVRDLVRRFESGEIRELHLASTRFLSAGRQRPEVRKLLPIDPKELLGEEDPAAGRDFLFEPSESAIFQRLLPKYLEMQVYGAVLEALASEMAMKRAAMKAATDAANDMIVELTRQFNRARQEAITNELLEITSGAEALRNA